jgi:hypothetical protein
VVWPSGHEAGSWHWFIELSVSPSSQAIQKSIVFMHSTQLVLQIVQVVGFVVVFVYPLGHEVKHWFSYKMISISHDVQYFVDPEQVKQPSQGMQRLLDVVVIV